MDYTSAQLAQYIAPAEGKNFFLLAGPCVIEGEEMAMRTAEKLKDICEGLHIPLIFKGSYRKANRSRLDSFTGIGNERALRILDKVSRSLDVPVVTDIHESTEAAMAAEYVDMLQIPAFLCRQTDLLVAAARTGRYVNIKKGQFLAPASMAYAVEKVCASGCGDVSVTDRGTMMGYSDLVVDFRGIPIMKQACHCPVIMDITHSLQQPNQGSGVTGGLPSLISTIARGAIATGADGIFMETHPDPSQAKSDGANMLPLAGVKQLLEKLVKLYATVQEIDGQKQ